MRHISLAYMSFVCCFYEENFMNLLTPEKKYGIIAAAEIM